jgi:hypothetical protein
MRISAVCILQLENCLYTHVRHLKRHVWHKMYITVFYLQFNSWYIEASSTCLRTLTRQARVQLALWLHQPGAGVKVRV